MLEQCYPKSFDLNYPKPLKLKIHLDIRVDLKTVNLPEYQEIRKNKVLLFVLDNYCSEPEYLRLCLVADAVRVDLAGQGTEQTEILTKVIFTIVIRATEWFLQKKFNEKIDFSLDKAF